MKLYIKKCLRLPILIVMEKQLERLLRYAFLQGISPEEIREYLEKNFGGKNAEKDIKNAVEEDTGRGIGNDFEKSGGLVLIDKRAGKKLFLL